MSARVVALRACLVAVALLCAAGVARAGHVNVVTVDGSINPASSDYIITAIAQSEADGAEALLIELDTPGGLLISTKDIIQAILNAQVPVIVYVAPRGAWAASAGTFITLAANVAAMAPGTSIGAASPISAGGGGGDQRDEETGERTDVSQQKAEKFTTAFIESIAAERKRNVEWAATSVREADAITADEALELGVIDLIASNRADLLAQVDGREVTVEGEPRVLTLADVEVRTIEMDRITKLFNFLADPQIAALLFLGGLLGLYFEFNSPGLILPGIAGAIALVLAGIAFQILPFSWAGLILMLIGLGLFVAEVFVTSFGVLFALGIGFFLFGGSILFDLPEAGDLTLPFWDFVVPVVAGFSLFAAVVVFAVGRTVARGQTVGVSELIGLVGTTPGGLEPDGKVFVRGEYWQASADEAIGPGEAVEVTAVEGLRLRVRRARHDG